MALNSDFKVKDSLYVGNSACFVTMTDTPKILSAGAELFDIFLQEGEIAASCTLTNGTGIDSFSFDTSADITINVNDAVIDGIAEGNAQGKIAVTDLGNTTTQVDVNGMQTTDSPTFGGLALQGALTTNSTVDGRDIAADAAQLAILQGLSGDNGLTFSSGSQGSLSITDLDGDVTNIDLGTQTGDSPTFAGVTADGIQIGVTAANEIDTASGNLTIDSAGGTTIIDDATTLCGAVTLGTGTVAGVSNTVLVSDGGVVKTDVIDSRVWGSTLVDGSGTASKVALWSDGDTIGNANITQDLDGSIQIDGGLSATGVLSGDGSGLIGVTATAVNFPSVNKNDLDPLDKFFIQDNSDGGNKFTSYSCILADAAGTGLSLMTGDDSICIAGSTALTNCKIPMWDSGNGCFLDTVVTQSTAGNIHIGGGLTVTDNLSVMGTFTCIDTTISVTSALSVVNTGTGPALYAEQTGVGEPIAQFVDTEGGQVVIGDTGNVGIGGSTDAPAEKLVVTGNACVVGDTTLEGDTQIGGTPSDIHTICGGTVVIPNVPAGTQSGNQVLVKDSSNCVVLDSVDSKIFGTALVDGEGTQNKLPKYTNGTGTIGDSTITDSGSLVTIGSDTKIDSNKALQVFATGGSIYSEDKTFTATVGTGGTAVTTFAKSGLNSVKYNVTLVKGVNKTAFEILVVYNGTTSIGTVYGIVDAQAASQLDDIEVSNSSSTIDLTITSASASTTAIIQGKALY